MANIQGGNCAARRENVSMMWCCAESHDAMYVPGARGAERSGISKERCLSYITSSS